MDHVTTPVPPQQRFKERVNLSPNFRSPLFYRMYNLDFFLGMENYKREVEKAAHNRLYTDRMILKYYNAEPGVRM